MFQSKLPAMIWLLTACGYVFPVTGNAQQPSIDLQLETRSVKVAQPLMAVVTVQTPGPAEVDFAPLGQQWGSFDVVTIDSQDDIPQTDGTRVWIRQVQLESLSSGTADLPPWSVTVRIQDQLSTLATEPQTIEVVSVLTDRDQPTEIRDIAGAVAAEPECPAGMAPAAILAAGVLLTGLTLAIAIGYFRYRTRKIDPDVWVQQQLTHLQSADRVPLERWLEDFEQALRSYLAGRFSLPAQALGRDELIAALPVSKRIQQQGKQILRTTNEARFAGLPETAIDRSLLISDTRRWIENLTRGQQTPAVREVA